MGYESSKFFVPINFGDYWQQKYIASFSISYKDRSTSVC